VFKQPSEIVAIATGAGEGNPNFGVLYDTCHAHMVAKMGRTRSAQGNARRRGNGFAGENQGKITHVP